jgi:ATP-dependent DNA helicase RecG
MPIQFETALLNIPYIVPQKGALLQKYFNIFNVADLLSHYPYRYIDKSKIYTTDELDETLPYIQLYGYIKNLKVVGVGPKARLTATFMDDKGTIELVWFQAVSFHAGNIKSDVKYLIFGRPQKFGNKYSIVHPDRKIASSEEIEHLAGFQAIYSTSETMKKKDMDSEGLSKLMNRIWKDLDRNEVFEYLPHEVISKYQLMSLPDALEKIHFPKNAKEILAAQKRIKFEEFFHLQFKMLQQKTKRKKFEQGFLFPKIDLHFDDFYKNHLPFQLTNAQKNVLRDIRKDTMAGRQMNRLVQGDVGSGKTIVGLMSMLMAIDNGFQACMMAPTEILARQHYEGLSQLLQTMDLQVEILTGSTSAKNKKRILDDLKHGKIDILLGTHALIEPTVIFSNLGLVVIDEQHRFGVAQRGALWEKNSLPPHILVMTATPIPRTLAMTIYGDLDYSVIDELPPGRKPIATRHVFNSKKQEVFHFVRKEIDEGRQVYIVFPLIEESEKMDLKNLEDGYAEIIQLFPSPKYTVAKVHGKMKNDEKNAQMELFVSGKAQILVSTTVIEVGVNVPNASIMVIENAERFGLSQLHQLRGRVGRGADQSYCILMTDYQLSIDGRKRMNIMVETNNGFVIAEEDLKMRGPGDISGTRQSGDVQLKLASVAIDGDILAMSRQVAIQIVEEDSELRTEKYKNLKRYQILRDRNHQKWGRIS